MTHFIILSVEEISHYSNTVAQFTRKMVLEHCFIPTVSGPDNDPEMGEWQNWNNLAFWFFPNLEKTEFRVQQIKYMLLTKPTIVNNWTPEWIL